MHGSFKIGDTMQFINTDSSALVTEVGHFTPKYAKDPILSDEEMALIEYSSIPIIPLIQQELSRHGDKTNIFLRNAEFIDVIDERIF